MSHFESGLWAGLRYVWAWRGTWALAYRLMQFAHITLCNVTNKQTNNCFPFWCWGLSPGPVQAGKLLFHWATSPSLKMKSYSQKTVRDILRPNNDLFVYIKLKFNNVSCLCLLSLAALEGMHFSSVCPRCLWFQDVLGRGRQAGSRGKFLGQLTSMCYRKSHRGTNGVDFYP